MFTAELMGRLHEIFGAPNNFPDFELNKARCEVQRITLLRNTAVQYGAAPFFVVQLDKLVDLNAQMVQLGSQPLCHEDLKQMWLLMITIRAVWGQIQGIC